MGGRVGAEIRRGDGLDFLMTVEIRGEKRGRLPRKPAEIWTWREWAAFAVFAAWMIWMGDCVVRYILNQGG